ncbi:hypothetical protein KEM52_005313 [Ascosphaera acerosa]|nr:hypothetical protein KEM52_005313 [Ascosphaera acerosa]
MLGLPDEDHAAVATRCRFNTLPASITIEPGNLKNAADLLVGLINQHGCYRFTYRRYKVWAAFTKYDYCCLQDKSQTQRKRQAKSKRLMHKMERFDCHSKIRAPRRSTLTLLWRERQRQNLPGLNNATQKQIYRMWQSANAHLSRRHDDPTVSSMMLLNGLLHLGFTPAILECENVRGIGFLLPGMISTIGLDNIVKCAIDATVLAQLLGQLRDAGLDIVFFHTDKYQAEVNAIEMKLASRTATTAHTRYKPAEAAAHVESLDIFWALSVLIGLRRRAQQRELFETPGRLKTIEKKQQDELIDMFQRHFNMHLFISLDENRLPMSLETISWVSSEQWIRWARAGVLEMIPVLRSTMIVKSHWRSIKHNYLERYNRPRIDLVVYILATGVVKHAAARLRAIQSGNYWAGLASWRNPFRRTWLALSIHVVSPASLAYYRTDPNLWRCSCPAFSTGRFWLCKHLISCVEVLPDPRKFLDTVRRLRRPPLWADDQLAIKPKYRVSTVPLT